MDPDWDPLEAFLTDEEPVDDREARALRLLLKCFSGG
jgi:hypothetical protein